MTAHHLAFTAERRHSGAGLVAVLTMLPRF